MPSPRQYRKSICAQKHPEIDIKKREKNDGQNKVQITQNKGELAKFIFWDHRNGPGKGRRGQEVERGCK